MKIQDFKSLMELQAIQQFTAGTTQASSSSSLFQEMLAKVAANETNDKSTQTLGSLISAVETQAQSILSSISLPRAAVSSSPVVTNEATPKDTGAKTNYDDIISQAATLYKLPEKLIKSVIKQESNFNPTATSYAGASGLMQLMPATAKSLGVTDSTDPEQNIMAGSKYLSQMMNRYGGDVKMALAAYNAGPGNVDKYNGIPPFSETQHYVQNVFSSYIG